MSGELRGLWSMRLRFVCSLAVLPNALSVSNAAAQETQKPTISASAKVMSDYRFRGYSRSEEQPAAEVNLDAAFPTDDSGNVFVGATAIVTVDNSAYGPLQGQLYAGLDRNIGVVRVSLGGTAYFFDHAAVDDFVELFGAVDGQLGPVSARAGVAWAPAQGGPAGVRGLYVYSDVNTGLPGTAFTITAHLGWEDMAYFRDKWDWKLGVTYTHSPFSFGLDYVDSNRAAPYRRGGRSGDGADATLVARAGISF